MQFRPLMAAAIVAVTLLVSILAQGVVAQTGGASQCAKALKSLGN